MFFQHLFASSGSVAIQQKVKELAECNLGIKIEVLTEKLTLEMFKDNRLGKYRQVLFYFL